MALLISETSHVLCCVLPTLFSIASLLSGAGLVTIPASWVIVHKILHNWELPIMAFSAAVLALGWWLHHYSNKIDCHDTGCHHPPCDTKKDKVHLLLKVATVLFVANLFVYVVFHRGMGLFQPPHENPVIQQVQE